MKGSYLVDFKVCVIVQNAQDCVMSVVLVAVTVS